MMKYNTVIWDLDGTLLNTLTDLMNSINFALAKFDYPPRTLDEIRRFVGNGVRVLMELSIPDGFDNPNYDEAFEIFSAHYAEHNMDNTGPYEGVIDVIRTLSDMGVKQAIVSNKVDSGVQTLNAAFFGVDTAIGEQAGLERKPAPDMVWKAMEILGANKETTVYIGDTEVDLATARNSGLDSISVLWGFRSAEELTPHNPMRMVNAPEEILKIISC